MSVNANKCTRFFLGILALMGGFAGMGTPASASEQGDIAFDVFFYAPPTGPVGTPWANSGGIRITHVNACAGLGRGTNAVAGLCDIEGSGSTDTGWCNSYTGTLHGSLTIRSPLDLAPVRLTYSLNIMVNGETFIGQGTATNNGRSGPMTVKAVYLYPGTPLNPGYESCWTTTATQFRVIGEATFATL